MHSGLPLSFSLPLSGDSCEGSLQKGSLSPCLSLSLAVRQSPESYPLKPFPGHFWTLKACSKRAGIGLNRAKNSMTGPAVLREHRKDTDIRKLVQRVHTLPAENEERWVHIVRIMGRCKGTHSGFKSLPGLLPTM